MGRSVTSINAHSQEVGPEPRQSAFPPGGVEITFPAPPLAPPLTPEPAPTSRLTIGSRLIILVVFALVICGDGYAAFRDGENSGRTAGAAAISSSAPAPLQVPKAAIIINQCAPGQGTQYVLPKDMTHGPIYDVYRGQVVGLEYLISKSNLTGNQSFFGLPLYNQRYDHVDIGLLSATSTGPAAQPYHINLYMISRAAALAISCT